MPLRLLLASILLVASVSAQVPDWVPITSATNPPPLADHLMATDWFTVFLFGGYNGTNAVNDTWSFDGTNWTQLSPATSPSARRRHSGAYDLARGRLVMFGGEDSGSTILGDTWEFDGTNWIQMTPATVPPPRRDHCMAYDFASGLVIMFSGRDSSNALLTDMWAWDGTDWTSFSFLPLPPLRWGAQMVWDPANGNVVMFGGSSTNFVAPLADTWIWSGLSWTAAMPAHVPAARYAHCMTYDDARQRVCMYGGHDGASYVQEVWEFDGTDWFQRPADPPPVGRRASQMVHVLTLSKTFMYGGWRAASLSDGWELRPNLLWQGNQPGASLDLDNAPSGSFTGPARRRILPGESGTATLTTNLGTPGWDLGFSPGGAVPLGAGGFAVPGGQIVNLDLTLFSFLNGGTLAGPLPTSPFTLPFTGSNPLIATAQFVTADATQALGFALSAAGELTVLDATYLEDFESTPLSPAFTYPLGWTAVFGTTSWLVWEGSTPTVNTGPAGDHTSGLGKYLYAETSANNLSTFSIDMGTHSVTALSNPTLDFWYQMDGTSVGTLHVEQFDGTNWNSIWSVTGAQGTHWVNARVPLTPMGGNVQLRFTYMANGSNGDCGIDDISIGN